MEDKISVIIPTYNRITSLERTLYHIKKSKVLPDEIIIVDQSSDKEVVENIKKTCEITWCKIKYFHLEKPSSTHARNLGIKVSSNDFLVFMDDDVDVQDDTFSSVKMMLRNDDIAMLGGVNSLDKLGNTFMSYIFNKASFRKRKIGHVTSSMSGRFPIKIGKETPTEWAMGFFFAVKKTLLYKWNIMFDENLKYYAYGEDLDFSFNYYKNCKKENKKCIMSDLLLVRHNVTNEYRSTRRSVTFMKTLHTYYMSHKHYPNDFSKRIACKWALIGDFFKRLLDNDKPLDIIKSEIFYYKYRKQILNGNFHYELFM